MIIYGSAILIHLRAEYWLKVSICGKTEQKQSNAKTLLITSANVDLFPRMCNCILNNAMLVVLSCIPKWETLTVRVICSKLNVNKFSRLFVWTTKESVYFPDYPPEGPTQGVGVKQKSVKCEGGNDVDNSREGRGNTRLCFRSYWVGVLNWFVSIAHINPRLKPWLRHQIIIDERIINCVNKSRKKTCCCKVSEEEHSRMEIIIELWSDSWTKIFFRSTERRRTTSEVFHA